MKPVPDEVLAAYTEITGPVTPIRLNFNAVYRAPSTGLVLRVSDSVEAHRARRVVLDDLLTVGAPLLAPVNPAPLVVGDFSADLYPECSPLDSGDLEAWADLLADLHATPAPDTLGPGGLGVELERMWARLPENLPGHHRDRLAVRRDAARAALAEMDPGREVVHGDAYVGNVVVSSDGPVFIDPDTLHLGRPLEDLAWVEVNLRRMYGDDGSAWRRLLARYGPVPGDDLGDLIEIRETVLLTWMAGLWSREPGIRGEFEHRLDTAADPRARWTDY